MAKKRKTSSRKIHWRATPLKSSFMAVAMLGLFISAYLIYPDYGLTWGVTLMVLFGLMFIASLVSMSKAPVGK